MISQCFDFNDFLLDFCKVNDSVSFKLLFVLSLLFLLRVIDVGVFVMPGDFEVEGLEEPLGLFDFLGIFLDSSLLFLFLLIKSLAALSVSCAELTYEISLILDKPVTLAAVTGYFEAM